MVQVFQPRTGDEYIIFNVPSVGKPIFIGPLSELRSPGSAADRNKDFGYLDPGIVYDDAGNKTVDHVDLSGQVVLMCDSGMTYAAIQASAPRYLINKGFTLDCRRSTDNYFSQLSAAAFVGSTTTRILLGGNDDAKPAGSYVWTEINASYLDHTVYLTIDIEGETISNGQKTRMVCKNHAKIVFHPDFKHYDLIKSEEGNTIYDPNGTQRYHPESIYKYTTTNCLCTWWTFKGVPTSTPTNLHLSQHAVCLVDKQVQSVVDKYFWPKLCQTAVLSAQYVDCNMIAMINDLRNLRGDLTGILEQGKKVLFSDLATKAGRKEISSFYLGNKYGYQLTYSDAKSIGSAFERLRENLTRESKSVIKLRSTSKSHADGKIPVDITANYMARVSPFRDPLCDGIRGLYDWDLYPSLGNMWDLIPYSFVADWVVGVGDLLEDIDANVYMRYYEVKSITKSLKVQSGPIDASFILGDRRCSGMVGYKHYRRWGEFSFDPMPLSLDFHPGDLLGHWTEGIGLWISSH